MGVWNIFQRFVSLTTCLGGLEVMKLPWYSRGLVCFDFLVRAEDGEESEATTGELTEFIEKAKMGEITNQDIPKFAKMFKVCVSSRLLLGCTGNWV